MTKTYNLQDLDLSLAQEYISSQDPEISLRFFLPLPNWMDGDTPAIDHPQIQILEKKSGPEWQFFFTNYTDNAEQSAKIDGADGIIFMGVSPQKALQLTALIQEYMTEGQDLTPDNITQILKRSHKELGIVDRFDKSAESIEKYFHPYQHTGLMGPYLPKPNTSSAVYIPGAGEFADGPTVTPQKFENGAFINFPGVKLSDLFARKSSGELKGRLVQADTFLRDRTKPDGSKIIL
ncbi:MAG: hypothetical protein MRY79_08410 [Alphaproteobacteria bacterium]|nr:hypothetical protein [Alphaproteobacteria bacterium]